MADGASDSVTVDIFGRTYSFAATADQSADHIRDVAALLDESMRQVGDSTRSASPYNTAILTALKLIDELWRLQEDYDEAESAIEERASRLADSLGRIFQHSATAAEKD